MKSKWSPILSLDGGGDHQNSSQFPSWQADKPVGRHLEGCTILLRCVRLLCCGAVGQGDIEAGDGGLSRAEAGHLDAPLGNQLTNENGLTAICCMKDTVEVP